MSRRRTCKISGGGGSQHDETETETDEEIAEYNYADCADCLSDFKVCMQCTLGDC